MQIYFKNNFVKLSRTNVAPSAGAVEYNDCISAEG